MTLRTREQERARQAMRAVTEAQAQNLKMDRYQTRAENLPSMLQNLGLAGTIAFLLSKEKEDQHLADDLATWLLGGAAIPWPSAAVPDSQDRRPALKLEKAICFSSDAVSTSALVYRQAHQEARLYAGWIKRWSKAWLGTHRDAPRQSGTEASGDQVRDRSQAGGG